MLNPKIIGMLLALCTFGCSNGDRSVSLEGLDADGHWHSVDLVRVESEVLTAYNIDVANTDNYFVKGNSLDNVAPVWVHNCDVPKDGKEYGSYTNTHASGKLYHGQGNRKRSQTSGRERAAENDDPHVATDWTSARNRREAMKDENRRIQNDGGIENPNNHNKINSPGRKYLEQDGG